MSCPGKKMCGRRHPHCEMMIAFFSSGTAPRMKVEPLSLVITSKWSAPPDLRKCGHVSSAYRIMSATKELPRGLSQ